jgi:hypothetical protein
MLAGARRASGVIATEADFARPEKRWILAARTTCIDNTAAGPAAPKTVGRVGTSTM